MDELAKSDQVCLLNVVGMQEQYGTVDHQRETVLDGQSHVVYPLYSA